MLRPLLALSAGIIWACQAWPVPVDTHLFLAILWVVMILCCMQVYSQLWWCRTRGLLLWLLYFALGLFLYHTHHKPFPDHWELSGAGEGIFTGRVLELTPRKAYSQLILSMKGRVDASGRLQRVSGKSLLLVRQGPEQTSLSPGSWIVFRASFQNIRAAKNPYSFDPVAYWKQKGINKQAWIGEEEMVLLRPAPKASLFSFQNRVLSVFKRLLPKEEQLGIAAALVLGDKSFLDKEVKSSYADSGAIHVLAVSGLHVGLVYGLFHWLIGTMAWLIPLVRRFRLICLLLLLIGYAAFTGASPSVCRAVLMLSCWMIGKALLKTPSVFNVLCVSAFLLLLADPDLLFDLGFQLSYSAVVGILFLYPVILRAWSPTNTIFQYGWKLLSVSIAAQLGTLPWSLFYFHQFPTYFGLSSLLIIPLVSLILIAAFGCLFFSWQPFLVSVFGWVLERLIDLCNEIVLFIQQLPMALIKDIWITRIDIFLYFILLLIVVQTFLKLSHRLVWAQLALIFLWGSVSGLSVVKKQKASSLIIYHTNDFFLADWLEQGHFFSLAEPQADSLQASYAHSGWRSFRGGSDQTVNRLPEQFARSDTALCWTLNKEQFLLIGPSSRVLPPNVDSATGKVLIADPGNPWPEVWLCRNDIRLLVLIPRRYQSKAWERLAKQEDIPVWSVKEKGAFEYKY